jgi:hypothetical protein
VTFYCIELSDVSEENIVSFIRNEDEAKQTRKLKTLRRVTFVSLFLNLLFDPEEGDSIFV